MFGLNPLKAAVNVQIFHHLIIFSPVSLKILINEIGQNYTKIVPKYSDIIVRLSNQKQNLNEYLLIEM